MVAAADGKIEPDHVVLERHRHVKGRRTGVIAHASADPADAGRLGFIDGKLSGAPHHQMAHAVVAIDQGRRWSIAHHADIGGGVDAPGAKTAHIQRQPDHAVSIAAAQIRLDHKVGQNLRITSGHAGRCKGAEYKGGEPRGGNAGNVTGHTGHAPEGDGEGWFRVASNHRIKPTGEVSRT